MSNKVAIEGQTFENWLVLEYLGAQKGNGTTWCKCTKCGFERKIFCNNLSNSRNPRCKCQIAEDKAISKANERAKNLWYRYKKSDGAPSEWSSFDCFVDDVGMPEKSQRLARLDESKPHSKSNSFWNETVGRMLTINGETKNLSEWAEIAGISAEAIRKRIAAGVTGSALIDRRHSQKKLKRFEVNGEKKTFKELAEASGLTVAAIKHRIKRGLSGRDLVAPPQKRGRKPGQKARQKPNSAKEKPWLTRRELKARAEASA